MEVEVAIRLLYMLGEALPASHGAHFSGDAMKTTTLQEMMRTVSLSRRGGALAWGRGSQVCGFSSVGVLRRQQLPAHVCFSGVL